MAVNFALGTPLALVAPTYRSIVVNCSSKVAKFLLIVSVATRRMACSISPVVGSSGFPLRKCSLPDLAKRFLLSSTCETCRSMKRCLGTA